MNILNTTTRGNKNKQEIRPMPKLAQELIPVFVKGVCQQMRVTASAVEN